MHHPFTPTRLASALALLLLSPAAWAICKDLASGNPALTASGGSVCNATLNLYQGGNVAGAFDDGSVLNLRAVTTIANTNGGGTHSLGVGGLNAASGASPAATVHAAGDLTVRSSNGLNSRAIHVFGGTNGSGARSTLMVDGMLDAWRNGGSGGAVIDNDGGVVHVMGAARLGAQPTAPATGPGATTVIALRNKGTTVFHNGVTINTTPTAVANSAQGASQGEFQVLGQAANIASATGSAVDTATGVIDLPVQTDLNAPAGTALNVSGGKVRLGHATALTLPDAPLPLNTSTVEISPLVAGKPVVLRGATALRVAATNGNTVTLGAGTLTATTDALVVSSLPGVANTVDLQGGRLEGAAHALLDGPGNTAVTIGNAPQLVGSIALGAGSDRLTLNGSNIDQVPTVDGGDDADVADGFIDRLSLSGMTGLQPAAKFINWEQIALSNGTELTLTGSAISTGTGQVAGEPMGLLVNSGTTLQFDAADFTVQGDLTQAGSVSLINANPNGSLTVSGDYSGGGWLSLDTVFGDSSSLSDRLIVQGTARGGPTLLNLNNLGPGAATSGNGILLVEVQGISPAGAFALPAPGYRDVNGWRYSLVQVGQNWYLQSQAAPPPPPPPPPAQPSLQPVPGLGDAALGGLAGMLAWAAARRRQRGAKG